MTLRDYWEILRRSWLLVLATTIAGALGAIGLSMLLTPVYQAQSQLFVSVQTSDEISGAYTGGLYVQQRIKSYTTVVDTPAVLDPVIDELDLDMTYSQLGSQVTAQNPTGTVLVNVLASNVVATQAAEIANAAAAALAAEIVRLETTESGAEPVQVELIRPAQVPGAPVSPRTELNVALGALLGLAAGFGIALIRATLDTSISSLEALEDATGATPLGSVGYDPSAAKSPLVTQKDPARSEAYRTIRTNLQYVDVDSPPRCVVVTSSVPQEGKSTTAANLAIALAQGGVKVLLVEADLRRPRVADYLGVDGTIGLTDILIGRAAAEEAIISWQRGLLDFLPSGAIPPNPSELLGSKQLAELLASLRTGYDILILDAPPLLPVTDAAILSGVADGVILVARYGDTRRDQVQQATAALAQVNGHVVGTILNFAPMRRRRGGYGYGYDYDQSLMGKSKSKSKSKSATGRQVLVHEDLQAIQHRG